MKHVPKRLPIGVRPDRDRAATGSGHSRDGGVTVAFTGRVRARLAVIGGSQVRTGAVGAAAPHQPSERR